MTEPDNTPPDDPARRVRTLNGEARIVRWDGTEHGAKFIRQWLHRTLSVRVQSYTMASDAHKRECVCRGYGYMKSDQNIMGFDVCPKDGVPMLNILQAFGPWIRVCPGEYVAVQDGRVFELDDTLLGIYERCGL